jgi:hypothetical protein
MNTSPALDEAILDTELRHINFFNGRLLTGGDLEAEQSAQHAHSRHLGEAIGVGVAFGLEVTPADTSPPDGPIVNITAGLAVNRAGQTLRLECDQRIALLRPPDPLTLDACIFDDCGPKTAGTTLASGTGFYVLLIAPASLAEGKAPVSGLGNGAAICNSRFLAEGVKFRLLRLNVTAGANAKQVRNAVAYQCFGLSDMTSNDSVQNALNRTAAPSYGVEALVPTGYLTARDVPLAIIEWKTGGLGFVDQWSVRRRLAKPAAASFWEPLINDRRLAEGEAMFQQFQDQIEELRVSEAQPASIIASDRFVFLPPIGFLPISSGSMAGFDYRTFFQKKIHRDPVFIEGAQVRSLMREALEYPPVDLSSGEMLWLYLIRENVQMFDLGSGHRPQPYVILVNGHAPYRGNARYDLNRWNLSNFGEI